MTAKTALTFGIQQTRRQTVEGAAIEIGTREGCALRLEDSAVSPIHAVIEVTSPTELRIQDMGSDNGTYVNGERVLQQELKIGDRVTVGNTTIVVQSSDALLKETAGYRESPLVAAAIPQGRALAPPRSSAARWWPAASIGVLSALYVALHGSSYPEWSGNEWHIAWPISRLWLALAIVSALLLQADALLRRPDGTRTPLGRLLVVLSVIAALPMLVQIAFVALEYIGYALATVSVLFGVGFLLYHVGRWIRDGRQ